MTKRLSRYVPQPHAVANRITTERDVEILADIARYRLITPSLLRQLHGGSARILDRLRVLFHKELVARLPAGSHTREAVYYIHRRSTLELLASEGFITLDDPLWKLVENNQKPRREGSWLFVDHELMISRFHLAVELACRASQGAIEIVNFSQGPELWDKVSVKKLTYKKNKGQWIAEDDSEVLPVRPDAFFTLRFPNAPEDQREFHFFYEADRRRTDTTKFRRKLRAHHAYIVAQRKHREHYGVNRIRAVLIETIDRNWAMQLLQAAADPMITGSHPTGLFWFSPSEFVTTERVLREDIWIAPTGTRHTLIPSIPAVIAPAPAQTLEDLELSF